MQSTLNPPEKPRQDTTLRQRKLSDALAGYAFMAPAMLILIVFFILPLFVSIFFSLTDWNGIRPVTSPGAFNIVNLENYNKVLFSGRRVEEFYVALKNTLYYSLGVVPLQTIFALVLAVIMNQKWLKGRGFFRTAFYFPSITSSVVISLVFVFLFTTGGPVNQMLKAIFPNYVTVVWLDDANGLIHNFLRLFGITKETFGAFGQTEFLHLTIWDWISGPSTTLFTVMLLAVWTTIGTLMVIYLAALQNVPSSVYEAAAVDGATGWQSFRLITLPILRPTTFFVVTISLIGTFQVFDQVYVISKGKPADTTLTLAYLVFRSAFEKSTMGVASATALILFAIILVATLIQRRVTGGDKANE